MVVVLLAIVAAHHESADAAVAQECFVHREIREIFLHCETLVGIERLTRLDRVERSGRVGGVTSEGVRGKAGRQLIAHNTTVRRSARSALADHARCVAERPCAARSEPISASRYHGRRAKE
ncbi:hypothetical protein RE9416_35390 [Prescottella equi]|nr:hypothetical protein RE9416_35390 [Prescottella equi]BCN60178.1 hypothetical protein RE9427_35480 [Prescottella equi]